ncbi:alpha/beta hydrolase [Nonlabens antarcticus]|uniref:alpha/beta hydrolase n=1 Tax=Nonlabens antarcticus TaxID=392714 RepID=UPI001891B77F|nr:alpha/beta hydrolase [Nonlabens antarcticus]
MLQLSHQLISGSGSTILFLHGFLGSSKQWKMIADHFKGTHQILMVDLPGHGDSNETCDYTIMDVADSINTILQQYKITAIHFIGHSMGGYVGCAFAKANSEKLLSLHLINSCAADDSDDRKSQRNRSIKLIEKYPDAFLSMAIGNLFSKTERQTYQHAIDQMKTEAQKMSTGSIKQAIGAMRDRNSQVDALTYSRFAVAYFYGSHDTVILKKTIKEEINILSASCVELDSGHMSLITHPQEIMEKLSFID